MNSTNALTDFTSHFHSWNAALLEEIDACERGDAAAADLASDAAEAACAAMLAAQARVEETDIISLARIAAAHNGHLTTDDGIDGIDGASIRRLINACLRLGRQ